MFVGDLIMRYLAAPLVEGDLQGLRGAIALIAQRNPRYRLSCQQAALTEFCAA
jgi:hypothetical protein